MNTFSDTVHTADLTNLNTILVVLAIVGVVIAIGLCAWTYWLTDSGWAAAMMPLLVAVLVGATYADISTRTDARGKDALEDAASLVNATWQDGVENIELDADLVCADGSGRALQVVPRDGSAPRQVAVRTAHTGTFLGVGGTLTLEVIDASACSPSGR